MIIYAYKWNQVLCNYVSSGTNTSHALIKTYIATSLVKTLGIITVKMTHFLSPTPVPPPG